MFIVVNAQVSPQHGDDESPDTPGLLRQLRSVVDVPIDRHAQTSLRALEIATQQWSRELQSIPEHTLRDAVLRDTRFHVVEISLMKAPAGPDKDRLERIPTALRASPDDVATLRKFVLQTVRADPQWQRLLHELQPPASTSARQTGAHVD